MDHPPGFYGAAEALLAVNALAPTDAIPALDLAGLRLRSRRCSAAEPVDLRPWLLAAAFCCSSPTASPRSCWPARA